MRYIFVVLVLIFLPMKSEAGKLQVAVACFLKGEQVSGLNKICFYDCAGSGRAITIKSYQVCPVTIRG